MKWWKAVAWEVRGRRKEALDYSLSHSGVLHLAGSLSLFIPMEAPGEYSTQNPQEEFGHTFQSSLVFNNPPSLKGKTPWEPISGMKGQEKKPELW